ncbi:MAG: peptide-methionine (S)-S-oxide reductase MsrA [Muribaculaceae bacterium]|nr:peptide-methionine (S)-S-oxide reductase MsrA [Muribaculaceae bacterium]
MEKKIYLAGGCFWGTDHLMSLVPGVVRTVAGYANSRVENPTYKMVCTGETGAAETVEVVYDADRIGLSDLLTLYFRSINPLSVNKQGNDVGTQYRTGIYYTDEDDLSVISAVVAAVARRYSRPLAVEVEPLRNFYPAEEYHQDYLYNNPGGYCHIDRGLFMEAKNLRPYHIVNRAENSIANKEELRRRLTPLQWEVTQNGATERENGGRGIRPLSPIGRKLN